MIYSDAVTEKSYRHVQTEFNTDITGDMMQGVTEAVQLPNYVARHHRHHSTSFRSRSTEPWLFGPLVPSSGTPIHLC